MRLEKKISLEEISAESRINIKFLEAIDRGDLDILPQPYIRAFLREYARRVGFDEQDLMRRYDEHKGQQKSEPFPVSAGVEETVQLSPVDPVVSRPILQPAQIRLISLSLILIGVVALLVYFVALRNGDSDSAEIAARPFQEVIRELEEEAEERPIAVIDSPESMQQQYPDSLVLGIAASDTVWLTILIDNIDQREYILRPNNRMQWRAANQFLLTVGNAGGISLQLNGDSLGVLGRQGEVVRNLNITRNGLQR